MNAEHHNRHPAGVEGLMPFARAALPPRARREAEQCLSLCLAWMEEPLRASIHEFDHRLFRLAEQARGYVDQQACFDGRTTMQREAVDFQRRFIARVGYRFSNLGRTADSTPTEPREPTPLALVDPIVQDQEAALAKIAARSESRSGPALFELGYRMAVLTASPPLEGEALPAGPRALTAALREAAEPLSLTAEHRLMFYQAFDAKVMSSIETMYGVLNEHFRNHGILPCLRAFPVRAPIAPPVGRGVAQEATATDQATGGTTAPAQGASLRSDSITVLESLRDLLAQRTRASHAGGGAASRLASADELQTALAALQGHLSTVADNASKEIRSAQRLRDELLAQLNLGRPADAQQTSLAPEHGDTVELTAMLFEQLAKDLNETGAARSLLGGLQLPMLRVAVADRGFFDQRDHPARRLLNTVTEAAHDWLDNADGEADRGLVAKLDQLVANASKSPTIDPRWLADIEHHVATLAHKAEIAERRHLEAMEGRDRLAHARRRASELMSERMSERSPRGLLRILLERTWSDVLALNLLRGDEDSDAFKACLDITEQLLGRKPVTDPLHLQAEVIAGLTQVGIHPDEAAEVASRLLEKPVEEDRSMTVTDVALRLKQHPRLGETRARVAETAIAAPPKLTAREQQMLAKLKDLKFGTWFEFVQPQGTYARRKLAWFSPVTGRCLFVNQRGIRCHDRTLTQLAQEMARGEAREMAVIRSPLIDRALASIAGSLRKTSHAVADDHLTTHSA